MKKDMGFAMTALLGLTLGFWGCQRSPIPTAPPPPAPTFTPTSIVTATATPTGTATSTASPTPSVTGTFTPSSTATPSSTPTVSATATATASATSSPTPSHTITPPVTASSTPTSSATSTATASATSSPTPSHSITPSATASPTFTFTASPTPASGCVTVGHYAPTPGPTISLATNAYSANLFPASGVCGASFNQVRAYVMNLSSSSPATLEFAVYDNSTLVADTNLVSPPSGMGWLTAAIPPVTFPCGDSIILVVHNPGPLVEIAQSGQGCSSETASQTVSMPSTYPDPSFLSNPGSSGSSLCYGMALDSCGTSTPSPTDTASPTATSTPTASAGACGSVFGEPATPTPFAGAEHISNFSSGVTTSHIAAAPYNLPADGLVTSLSAVFPITTPSPLSSGEVRLALYSDSSGSPGSLLAEATPVPYVNGQAVYTALVPPTNLTAGTYWLAAQGVGIGTLSGGVSWGDMFLGLYSQSGSGVDEAVTYGPFPSNMAPTSVTGYTYQLWANYCPDTPTPTPTP